MSNLWLKIRIWTKFIVLALLVIYVALFLYFNPRPVEIWVFPRTTYLVPTILLVFLCFAAGVFGTLVFRIILGTIRQVREMRQRARAERIERELAEMKSKADKLQARRDTLKGNNAPPA